MNGSANPPADLCVAGFVFFEVLVPPVATWPDPGQEVFVRRMPVGLGGALNAASVAKGLGLDVVLAAPLGKGLTDVAVRHALLELAIPTATWEASASDLAVSLVISSARDRSFLSAVELDALASCPELPEARWIHVGGLREARALAPQLARAKTRGAKISVSGSWIPEELSALAQRRDQPWDLLVMNGAEAAFAAGDVGSAPMKLSGAARDVIITQGKQGAFGRLDGAEVRADGHPIQVVDPSGAGDAFAAGLITALLQGKSGDESLVWGVRAAEHVLGIRGGVAPPALFSGWDPRP